MGEFFFEWWLFISDGREAWKGGPTLFAYWLAFVLGQIAALVLGGLGATYVQGLVHAQGIVANAAILVGVMLASLFLGVALQLGTDDLGEAVDSELLGNVLYALFFVINAALVAAAAFAVYSGFRQSIQVSSKIAISALVLGIALKLGSFLFVGVIIPIFKAIPALLFGEGFRRWMNRRAERKKAKEKE
jgi:hypothetical protein